LIAGSVGGQLITLGVTPLLARLYQPADFGYVALIVSTASIVAPVAALRMESALMLPKSNRDATVLFTAGLWSAVVVSALSAAVLQLVFAFGGMPTLARLPWLSAWVALISLLTAIFTLLSQFALRGHDYASVSLRTLYQATLSAAGQLGFGLFMPSGGTLASGYALGRVAGIAPLALRMRRHTEPFDRHDFARVARQYWRFAAYFAPAALLNAAGLVIPLIFVGSWFSISAAGHWSMAERLVAAPLVLIATSVSQVTEAHLASMRRQQTSGMERYYLRVSGLLLAISCVLVLIVVFAAPWAIPIFLGDGWSDTAEIMIAFCPLLATRLIASPMSKVLVVQQQGAHNLALDIVRIVAIALVVTAIVSLSLTLSQTAWLVSAALSSVYVITWFAGWRAARLALPPMSEQ